MFNQSLFNCTRGNVNCESSPFAGTQHYYVNFSDTVFSSGINNMTDSGYFPANFAFEVGQVLVGDLLFLEGSDGHAWTIITAVSPSVTFTLLPNPVAETNRTIATEASGIWASPIPVTFQLLKNGHQVTLTCVDPAFSVASVGATIQFTAAVLNIPGYVPAYNNITSVIPGEDNNTAGDVTITLMTSGNVAISRFGSNFTGAGVSGFDRFNVSYQAA